MRVAEARFEPLPRRRARVVLAPKTPLGQDTVAVREARRYLALSVVIAVTPVHEDLDFLLSRGPVEVGDTGAFLTTMPVSISTLFFLLHSDLSSLCPLSFD